MLVRRCEAADTTQITPTVFYFSLIFCRALSTRGIAVCLFRRLLAISTEAQGAYSREAAMRDHHRHLLGLGIDHTLELGYYERKRIHNLKYFTWVEQQGKDVRDLDAQWYDSPDYWLAIQSQVEQIDNAIRDFNHDTGLG